MKIKISVIIPTWKRVNILKEVIESLLIQNYPKNHFEVIICDSESKDGTYELIKSYQENNADFNIRLINSSINAQSIKRNDGAKSAKSDILIFLDDDVIPSKNLLNEYYSAHKKSKNVVFIGLSLFSNKRAEKSNFLRYRNNRAKKIISINDKISPENFVSMNFSIKKNDFIKIGMFDPVFTNYGGEDHDFPIRMKKMGFNSRFCPGAVSEHREPTSTLFGRMNKIFVSANKGFIPLKEKFPSFFSHSQIGLLEDITSEDSKLRIVNKKLIKCLLNKRLIKFICRYLVWSDRYPLLYMPILYKIVFAFAYFDGVKKRYTDDEPSSSFINWEFWENNNQD